MANLKQQLLKGFFGLTAIAAIYAFTKPASTSVPLDIFEAIKLGKVTLAASNNGGFSNESIHLNLKNNTSSSISLKIPAGTVFKPSDEGDQDLIVPIEDVLVLSPKAQLQKNIDAYCIQANDRSPDKGGIATITKNSNDKLGKLMNYFSSNSFNKDYVQDALWAVSDGHSICNVGNSSDQDKKLRTFLAELTGQENKWYHTPQQRVVEEDRTIQRETVTINGQLSYTVPKGTTVYDEVVSADGTSFFKSQAKVAPYGGKVEFTFNMKVKGWKKGDYFVKVKTNNSEIAVFPFSIS